MSLLVDEITPVSLTKEDAPTKSADKQHEGNTIIVPHGTSKAELFALNKLLQDNKGIDEVTLIFQNGAGERELKLPYGINFTPALQSEIKELLIKEQLS